MKGFFTDLSIWTGAIVGLLTVIDWLVTEAQKASLRKWAERSRGWLETQRLARLISLLKNYRFQLVVSVATYFLLAAAERAAGLTDQSTMELFAWAIDLGQVLALVVLVWKVHPRLVRRIVQAEGVFKFLTRLISYSVLILLFSTLVLAVFFGSVFLLFYWFASLNSINIFIKAEESFMAKVVGGSILFFDSFCLSLGFIEWGMITSMLVVSLLWLFLTAILIVLIRASQFVLARIAESPKGPVLGISGLLIGIGAVVKAFL